MYNLPTVGGRCSRVTLQAWSGLSVERNNLSELKFEALKQDKDWASFELPGD